jgi:signal transduction histidine kinase
MTEDRTRAQLEQRVRELERELEAHTSLLSTVGHELRNPLSPIFMQAQYLLDYVRQAQGGFVQSEWLIGHLEALCDRMQRFIAMLNRIMDVSRVAAGHLDLELESVDFSDVVREAASAFEREALAARSPLRIQIPERTIGVWDRLRLSQIVTNLVSNAIRYGAGKPISITLVVEDVAEDPRVRLEVRDHGIGIAPEDQLRIFRRFERATQRRSGGFGIGLWIVHESCRAMGGSIEVESTPGEGSRFIVSLPRDASEPARDEHE